MELLSAAEVSDSGRGALRYFFVEANSRPRAVRRGEELEIVRPYLKYETAKCSQNCCSPGSMR
ncbi:hypothetical protein Mapa_014539 [Marchantia paleacea]|nr:hypothetical protein Mapa_014539 [Marchantia paleacea]